MKQEDLNELFIRAKAYAEDPTTDRAFLAGRFLEAMLKNWIPNKGRYAVQLAFEIADEFIKESKENYNRSIEQKEG